MHEPEHWGYVYFDKNSMGATTDFTVPEDEHIKWYLYELYRNQINKNSTEDGWILKKGILQKESKLILGKSVTAILEKNNFGFDIWIKSPFTNKKLVIHTDGKFETYNDTTN